MKLTIKEKQTIPLAIEETAHGKRQEELGATSDIGLLLFRLVAECVTHWASSIRLALLAYWEP